MRRGVKTVHVPYQATRRSVGTGIGVVAVVGVLLTFTGAGPTAAAALQQVLVTNTATNPVQTRDVDKTAQQPFQKNFHMTFDPGQLGTSATFTVPAGKRLVLENVSGDFMVQNGMVVIFSVTTTANGAAADHRLVLTPQGAAGGYPASYAGGQELHLYADPGTTVTLYSGRQQGGTGDGFAAVSGYLAPAT
jgi:hypothetical protein